MTNSDVGKIHPTANLGEYTLPTSNRFRSVRMKFMNGANALLTAESGQKAVQSGHQNQRLLRRGKQQSFHNPTESAVQGRKS